MAFCDFGMSKVKKGKCCPLIDGSREKRLVGLAKLAEVGVILVALFVLQEVRTNVIPWGCPLAQKQSCIRSSVFKKKKRGKTFCSGCMFTFFSVFVQLTLRMRRICKGRATTRVRRVMTVAFILSPQTPLTMGFQPRIRTSLAFVSLSL